MKISKNDEALKYLEEALQIKERFVDKDNVEYARTISNLASMFKDTGKI